MVWISIIKFVYYIHIIIIIKQCIVNGKFKLVIWIYKYILLLSAYIKIIILVLCRGMGGF